MFIHRQKELNILKKGGNTLIYGKRRVGKTSLIKEHLKNIKTPYFYYECIKANLNENMEYMLNEIMRCDIIKYDISFKNLYDLFSFINSQYEKIVIVIDEYPYLKEIEESKYVDSLFQKIIDQCKNIDFIISGSHIGMMQELLQEGNSLYGRFNSIINVEEFDYLEASYYYKGLKEYDKIAFYSVFGGSPYINEYIDGKLSLKENIIKLFLDEKSNVYNYAASLLISDASSKVNAKSILAKLSNSKLKYKELEEKLDTEKNGKLAKQLKVLLDLKIIRKVFPINKLNDTKKSYYEINDNILRFYFTYIYKNKSALQILGPNAFYDEYIDKSLLTYISHRFEEQVRMYFSLQAKTGKLSGVKNIGTLYYDDSKNKTNGEFDVVLERESGYKIYDVKYMINKLDASSVNKEIKQVLDIESLKIEQIGFVNPGGFEEQKEDIDYIDSIYN